MPKPLKDFEQEIPTQDFLLEALLWLLSREQSGGCKSVGLGMLPGCGLVRVRCERAWNEGGSFDCGSTRKEH